MKYIAAIVLLWGIALTSTCLIVKDAQTVSYLAPVFLICLVGSIMTVRHAVRARVP